MKDILARNPKLDDVIRKAANRLGENHGLTRDSHGVVIDNQGNSTKYVGSGGQHPSQLNKPKSSKTFGWHRTLNETEELEVELEEDCLDEDCGEAHEEEFEEATGASSSGSFESPLFGPMTEDGMGDDDMVDVDVELAESKVLRSIIKEEISKKVSKQQIKESLKNRLTRNILNEKDYISGKLKYEKPSKLPGEIKSMPGMKQTDSTLKKSKSTNNEYLKQFDKKIKDYLDFEGNSHPEFPHQNNSKTDYKSPMYRNTAEDEEFIEDFRGMGLEDANGADMLDRVDDYLSGSQETGNAQTGKDGKALGNVVPNKVGEKIKKKVKRKKDKVAKQKSKMTNLRGITPDVQTTSVKESVEIDRMKKLFNYKDTTQ